MLSRTLWRTVAVLVVVLDLAAFVFVVVAPTVTFSVRDADIRSEIGHAYYVPRFTRWAPLPILTQVRSDSREAPMASALRLFENETALPIAHVSHSRIREEGKGRYSHWIGNLYFSASDNSDPRTNGRIYTAKAPLELSLLGWIALFIANLSVVLLRNGKSPTGFRSRIVGGANLFRDFSKDDGLFAIDPSFLGKTYFWIAVALGSAMAVFVAIWIDQGWQLFSLTALKPVSERLLKIMLFAIAIGTVFYGLRSSLAPGLAAVATNSRCFAMFSRVGVAVAIAAVVFAFCAPLVSNWTSGESIYMSIGGVVPWSDAKDYQIGTIRLLNTATIDGWNERRPINVAVNTVFYALAGRDLPTKLFLHTLIVAFCSLFAAREIMRSHGAAAATAFVVVVLGLASPYLPTTLSENNGMIFGLVAFGLLWRHTTAPHIATFSMGMFFLTVALNARAGPFFVLPAILCWEFFWARRRRGGGLASALAGLVAIFVGFALPKFYIFLLGTGEGMAHGNFAYTLYGLATGGKGWQQIYKDHPEIFLLPSEGAQAHAILLAALERAVRQPADFVTALFIGLLGFVARLGQFTGVPSVLLVAAMPLLVFADRSRHAILAWVASAGVLLSAPIIYGDGGGRVFAATFPFVAVLPGLILNFVLRVLTVLIVCLHGLKRERRNPLPDRPALSLRASFLAAAVGIGLFVGPPLLVVAAKRAPFPPAKCPEGQTGVIISPRQDTVRLQVFPDDRLARSFSPNVRYSDYIRDPDFAGNELAPILRRLVPPAQIALIAGPGYAYGLFALFDGGRKLPEGDRPVQLCGRLLPEAVSGWNVPVFYNPTVRTLPKP